MSVVLTYKVDGKVWMATDSQITRGSDKKLITDPNNFKIWQPSGHNNLIMGGVGTLRDLNIASTVDVWFDEIEVCGGEARPFELTFQYVVRHIVPALFAELSVNDKENISSFILAYRDKCFRIDFDGATTEIHEGEFEGIGSGGTIVEAAFGAVYDIETLSTREKIIRAVGQSCEQDLGVSYPILMMNTEEMTMEVFDGQTLFIDDNEIDFHDVTEYEFGLLNEDIEELMAEVQAIEEVLEDEEDYKIELTD